MEQSQPTKTSAQIETKPAALVNPTHRDGQVFTFSFAIGHHPIIRAFMEFLDEVLVHTFYRPFMRFMPIKVEHVYVPINPLLPALHNLTMVQISDIHHSRFVPLRIIEQAVAVANSLHPNVVFLTGDFVSNDITYAPACARALGRLQAPLGVYAILGNHDYWTDPARVTHELRMNGITVLINEAHHLTDELWVVGIDDAWAGQPDIEKAMNGVPRGAAIILLAHEPDFADQAQGRGFLLQLSGHSHGGQIRFPFTHRPVLPFLAWKYYVGLRRVGDLLVYTSQGLGTMQPPFIFTCRPQIDVLRLVS